MKHLILAIALAVAGVAHAGVLVDSQGVAVVDSQGQAVQTHDDPAQCPSCYQGG